eukprot:CAMPEP_0117893520 /NCGR_PEP_ID=MMETSP0950-20121206/25373_1 /TAXON_ID=44440 /ORGANISM="Chattonella subsalsa, Strain CCMP2191" /LENGTH=66 /DNA_ID=CAMNT_0005753791 /DNA_START=122 /DNA_END=322 /DNA_ORIENTATION=-
MKSAALIALASAMGMASAFITPDLRATPNDGDTGVMKAEAIPIAEARAMRAADFMLMCLGKCTNYI